MLKARLGLFDQPYVPEDEEITEPATGVPFVVVLVNGRPLVTSGWIDLAPAVLEAWHLGTEAAAAIVDVLTGAAEPAGRHVRSLCWQQPARR
jgi:hypothetical protein